MNIKVEVSHPIKDGTEIKFRSPVDCSEVTGLNVYYNGASTEFKFTDAHGNDVGEIDHLFAANVVVKVILDVTHRKAYVQNADTNAYLEGRFAELDEQINPFSITKFKVNGNSAREKGTTVASVELEWEFSKVPDAVTLDGEEQTANLTGTATKTGSFVQDTTWKLEATKGTKPVAMEAHLEFYNCVFYGALERNATINSATVRALTGNPQSTRNISFSINPNGKRPVFALPSDNYGTPSFRIGPNDYAWNKIASRISVNDASGKTTVPYDVWMHPQDIGNETITISVT